MLAEVALDRDGKVALGEVAHDKDGKAMLGKVAHQDLCRDLA